MSIFGSSARFRYAQGCRLRPYHALMERGKALAREMDERLSGFDMFATPA